MKKVIIDKLHISGLKIRLGFLPISVPATIELADIGRKSGGATLAEAWQQIWEGILRSAGVAGEQLKALGNLTGDAAKQASEAANKVMGEATKAAAQATESLSKATEGATKAVGDTLNKATEGASQALDSLKKLW